MPLTPQDIVRKEFREAFRGYNQADVDLFLDQITEEFARLFDENQRIKVRLGALQQELEQMGEGGAGPGGSPAARTVEDLRRTEAEIRARLRRFLEEQLRLLDAAERGASPTAQRIAQEAPPPPVTDRAAGEERSGGEFWGRE